MMRSLSTKAMAASHNLREIPGHVSKCRMGEVEVEEGEFQCRDADPYS